MKNWKKGLACLLAGVMLLAMLTACGGGLNLGVTLKGYGAASQEKCEEIAEELGGELAYSQELCDKAKSIANYLAGNTLELEEAQGQLVRVTSADSITITNLEDDNLQDALDYSGNCSLGFEKLGIGISYEVSENFMSQKVYYGVPKDGMVTDEMKAAAEGKTEIGAAYIMTSEATYIVTVFR